MVSEPRVVFNYTWWYLIENALKINFLLFWTVDSPSPLGDSPSPSTNSSNSPSFFMYSMSWCPKMQIFEFLSWNWTRIITLNCFWTYKPVFWYGNDHANLISKIIVKVSSFILIYIILENCWFELSMLMSFLVDHIIWLVC